MILQLFRYFARYPQKQGVLSMFTNGESQYAEYAELLEYVNRLSEPLFPNIESFVFGQSYDDVKKRIDSITGSYLFIDFGEFTSTRDSRNSIYDTQKLAVTIALKVPDNADTMEISIASDRTLLLLANCRKKIVEDSEQRLLPWGGEIADQQDIVPFVSPEFKSIGWTLMLTSETPDIFNVKASFIQQINSNILA